MPKAILILPGNRSRLIRIDRDVHPQRLFRQNLLDVLRPLHNAETPAVNVVVEPDVKSLRDLVNPVKIKMIHRLPRPGAIFIHNRESRRTDSVLPHTEPPANGRGESSLPSPHRSVERQNTMPFRLRKELTRSPVDVLQVLYDDLVSHIK